MVIAYTRHKYSTTFFHDMRKLGCKNYIYDGGNAIMLTPSQEPCSESYAVRGKIDRTAIIKPRGRGQLSLAVEFMRARPREVAVVKCHR